MKMTQAIPLVWENGAIGSVVSKHGSFWLAEALDEEMGRELIAKSKAAARSRFRSPIDAEELALELAWHAK
jgi:hypothetical protein